MLALFLKSWKITENKDILNTELYLDFKDKLRVKPRLDGCVGKHSEEEYLRL